MLDMDLQRNISAASTLLLSTVTPTLNTDDLLMNMVLPQHHPPCNNSAANSSCAQYHPPDNAPVCYVRYKPSLHVTGAVLTFLIWCANSLVVILFLKNRSLRRTASNYLLFSLSLIDFLSGASLAIFLLPFFYLHFAGCEKLHTHFGKPYFMAAEQFVNFLFLASVGHLLTLSTERVISLFWALNYEKIVRKYRVFVVCLAVWSLGLFLSSIQLTWQQFDAHSTIEDFERVAKYDKIFSLISFIFFAVIPAIILIVQYSCMFVLIRKLVKNCPGASQTRRSLKERKALVIYCSMFICYIFLVFPYLSLRIIIDHVDREVWEKIPPQIPESALVLRYIISIVNPLLYTLYKNDFRKALIRTYKDSRIFSVLTRKTTRSSSGTNRYEDGLAREETEMTLIQRRQSEMNGLEITKFFRKRSFMNSSDMTKNVRKQNSFNGDTPRERCLLKPKLQDANGNTVELADTAH